MRLENQKILTSHGGEVVREAFLNGSVLLLMVSLFAGYWTGESGWT